MAGEVRDVAAQCGQRCAQPSAASARNRARVRSRSRPPNIDQVPRQTQISLSCAAAASAAADRRCARSPRPPARAVRAAARRRASTAQRQPADRRCGERRQQRKSPQCPDRVFDVGSGRADDHRAAGRASGHIRERSDVGAYGLVVELDRPEPAGSGTESGGRQGCRAGASAFPGGRLLVRELPVRPTTTKCGGCSAPRDVYPQRMLPSLLVVDDDASIRRMLDRTLTAAGYEVALAADGGQALVAVERAAPDLIVLDLAMPGVDGPAVLRRLRGRGLATPVLLLTARDSLPDRVDGLDAGADDYLVKPFETDELLARIRALLRRGKMPRGTARRRRAHPRPRPPRRLARRTRRRAQRTRGRAARSVDAKRRQGRDAGARAQPDLGR